MHCHQNGYQVHTVKSMDIGIDHDAFLAGVVSGGITINTLRSRQNGRHFADDIFKRIFLNENIWILMKISLKFVPQGSVNNIPALVQIMAGRRPGDKPLSELMMVNLPTHICVTRPQWVNHHSYLRIMGQFLFCHEYEAIYSDKPSDHEPPWQTSLVMPWLHTACGVFVAALSYMVTFLNLTLNFFSGNVPERHNHATSSMARSLYSGRMVALRWPWGNIQFLPCLGCLENHTAAVRPLAMLWTFAGLLTPLQPPCSSCIIYLWLPHGILSL